MKVSDIMQKHVDFVSTEAKVIDVARFIFGRGINGVPVCEGKKVVGFVTERDILSKFFPSVQEYMEDQWGEGNFEQMEGKIDEVLNLSVSKIMAKKPIVIIPETPVLRAQSTMSVHKVGRLPVVDEKGHLVGIISKGDIFRALVGKKMPYSGIEEYNDWISKHYDFATDWQSRLKAEIPALIKIFKESKVSRILDIGCATGEHALALARSGFQVVGLEKSKLMHLILKRKWRSLPKDIQGKVSFVLGDCVSSLKDINESFDAAIFMGNTLADLPDDYLQVMDELSRVLRPNDAVVIAQLANVEKIIKVNKRLASFEVKQSKLSPEWEHAYLSFYDPPRKKEATVTLNTVVSDFNGRMWTPRGMNSVRTLQFAKDKLRKLFGKSGFKKISFYGTNGFEDLFSKTFSPLHSDWLNVVAER